MANTKMIVGSIVVNKNDERKGIVTDMNAGDSHDKTFIKLEENGNGIFVAPSTLQRYWKIDISNDSKLTLDDVAVTNDDEGAELDAEFNALQNDKPEINVANDENKTVVDEHIDAEIEKIENEIAPNDSTVVIKHDEKPVVETKVKPVKKVKTPIDTKLFDKLVAKFDFPDVSTRKTGSYTGLLVGKKLFAEVHITSKMTYALISSKCLTDDELKGLKISPAKYNWRLNTYIVINEKNFDDATKLIQKSYDATKLSLEPKKETEKVVEK